MSRGSGRTQRAIRALIASDEHGAWLVSDICKHVYPELGVVKKKHQVAVNRALSCMALPESWEARYSATRGSMRVLYSTRDPESAARADWLTKYDCSWDDYRERHLSDRHEPEIDGSVQERRDYYESDELSQIEQRIEKSKSNIAFLESAGAHEIVRDWTDELRSLEKRRTKLMALSRRK